MSVKSSVGFIHHVKKGAKVSYGGTWRASENSVIAVIPFGYADGLPRALSNKGRVLIRGEFCPITGIICMDYFMVDVTSLVSKDMGPEVGDEVVILGQQNENIILVQDIATEAGTIPYEILTGMQGRLPRIYIH
jgi:alanine racemase